MTAITSTYRSIAEAQMMPRLVHLGANLYGAVFTLMKLLPAHYILRRADLDEDTVVVETTSGTFGLALAMETALMRRRLVLVSDPTIDARLHARLTDLGATVHICRDSAPVGGFQGARLNKLAEIRAELPSTFCPEQYSNPDNPRSYGVVAEMLARSLGTVDCLVGAVGSGGSMCGTVGGLRELTPHTLAIGVDTHRSVLFGQPDGSRAVRGLGNSLWPGNLDHTAFDEVHWCSAAETYAATRRLHATHAVFQGPTSGAAYQVARWWADRHPDALCVVMLPDEGHRYLATVYDDAWLAEQGHTLTELPTVPTVVDSPAEAGAGWTRIAWNRRRYEDVPGTVIKTTGPVPEWTLS
ncbi:pyridoxal-phosphate dependent enzyme [Streptomyces noursei]|uniref:pyridoxal-phosphate dependent enzyme n=1 Tax=Streptomyces noursei TaxID=1971 RepID=UPI00167B26E6|nr:pyridoxal-phosphate dependent enzyme [Streptomyces noursei]MCZ1013287.1 pyridoxal-phosphate dependent enzyme [Streptomyces noursei]GGX53477.1 cystathionine beta-synthase [Streptomyces noursei]